jgi:co-chaperonin GroES (HSP10)
MKNFHPKKHYVLIEFVKREERENKTKGGLYLPNQDDKSEKGVSPGKYDFVVKEVGPEVEDVKVGDHVIFNEYDMKGLQNDDEEMFAIVQEQSIMATYE